MSDWIELQEVVTTEDYDKIFKQEKLDQGVKEEDIGKCQPFKVVAQPQADEWKTFQDNYDRAFGKGE